MSTCSGSFPCSSEYLSFNVDAPIVGDFDVIVCGAGPAGWVAAAAASRKGAKTAIIDRYGFPGGTATAGLVMPISGFYSNGERVVGGIGWEFVKEMEKYGAALVELPKGHVSADTEYYKLISQRILLNSGVKPYFNSYISRVITGQKDNDVNGAVVHAVIIEGKNGPEAITGKTFIDATGDGDIFFKAGAEMFTSDTPQPLSLCFELIGVDTSTPLLSDSIHHNGKAGHSVNTAIHNYLQDKYDSRNGPKFGGPWFNTMLKGNRLAVNVTRNESSALDSRAYSEAEFKLREDMFEIVELLREEYAEFKYCAISASAVNAGIREGRHLKGKHMLLGNELLAGKHFSDSIARNAHPVDIHSSASGTQTLKEMPHSGYIPYSCMVCDTMANIIGAGRLISADEEAHASIRVQATCMAIGQAAGTAAAICASRNCNVQNIDMSELQNRIKADEGII